MRPSPYSSRRLTNEIRKLNALSDRLAVELQEIRERVKLTNQKYIRRAIDDILINQRMSPDELIAWFIQEVNGHDDVHD